MIANASLDAIEEVMRRENAMYLKSVNKFNEWIRLRLCDRRQSVNVQPFAPSLSYGQVDMKFIILHETKNDDGIKGFFNDLWELYVKVRVSSLLLLLEYSDVFGPDGHESIPHLRTRRYGSVVFDNRVRASAKKNL